jgi:hypothetical protein
VRNFPPIVPELAHFIALLLIAGIIIRLIESKFPNTTLGSALSFIY